MRVSGAGLGGVGICVRSCSSLSCFYSASLLLCCALPCRTLSCPALSYPALPCPAPRCDGHGLPQHSRNVFTRLDSFRYGLDLKAQEAERRRIAAKAETGARPPAITAAEIERNVDWEQVRSIRDALRSLRLNSKTPGESGQARLKILQDRLRRALSQML